MCCDDGVLMLVVCRNKEVEKPEEFIDLLFGKVGVVAGVFYFKSVAVRAFSRHDIWQGIEAWVAYWNSDGVVAFLLQELNQYCFAVEASFAPAAKSYSIYFCAQRFSLLNVLLVYQGVGDKNCCPETLRKQCSVDAFVYAAAAW